MKNTKRKTTEEFISESIEIHSIKYDYSLVNYINNKTKIKIICPTHGGFEQSPQHHIKGSGCPVCSGNVMDTKFFISDMKKKYKYYNYSKSIYLNSSSKVIIECPIHGEFESIPGNRSGCKKCNTANVRGDYIDFFIKKCYRKFRKKYNYNNLKNESGEILLKCTKHGEFKIDPILHLRGRHCVNCEQEKKIKKLKNRRKMFFKKCKIKHDDKYEYNELSYKNQNSIIKISCPTHGNFTQKANSHVMGNGCIKCSGNELKTTDLFIKQSKELHNDYYDYSLVDYKGATIKVDIICPTHGKFSQTPSSHTNSLQGCPKCTASKGERIVRSYLDKNNILYTEQQKFEGCVYKNKLRFDFYISEKNICIEYDGVQHFQPIRKFGGKKTFELQKKKDNIKTNYCIDNNIGLIRIPYYSNVFELLDNEFNLKTPKIKEFFTPFQKTMYNINEFMSDKTKYKFSEMVKEIDHHYRSDSHANSSLRKFLNIPILKIEKIEGRIYIIKN
jgi:hypothetical protein